jgi:DNA-binding protein HU-beta
LLKTCENKILYFFLENRCKYLTIQIRLLSLLCKTLKYLNTMNKQDLIDSMAKAAGVTKVQAQAALDAFMSSTQTALKKGDKVILVGFGTFSVTKRAARKGRNPQTGKEINIPAKKVVKFKAGAGLQAKVK